RLGITTSEGKANYIDKGAAWAAKTWASWEKKESGWQRKVVDYGNQAFRRIEFEEWGLKSVPPLSTRRRAEEQKGDGKVELVFPEKVLSPDKAQSLILQLATERQALHRQRMTYCIIGMPFTIPFALVPVVPNLPFFYLVYRAWSHWRAQAGGKHIQWLAQNNLLQNSPSSILDKLYMNAPKQTSDGLEQPLLSHKEIRNFSETLEMPQLETELDRAIWQIEQARDKEAQAQKENAAAKEEKKEK
ncbi:hypothetical protein Golomagni_06695, partial [Golovinomyces magnicellulatus]